MSPEQLKIVFKHGTLNVEFVLEGIRSVLAKHKVHLTGFSLRGQPVSLSSVVSRLEKSGRKTFNLVGQGFEFVLGTVGNRHLDFLVIKSVASQSIPWDEWAAQFIVSPDFVMAWVTDVEYDNWQNAEDPLQYTAAAKTFAHLPLKSNGLPYPLEQQVIDISANPGRWSFQDGYIEAVGAVMWLGKRFAVLTGANLERVAKTPGLLVSHLPSSVTKIKAAEQYFTTAEGTSGELQAELRLLLFPPDRESTGREVAR
jgi:hypothetical protein